MRIRSIVTVCLLLIPIAVIHPRPLIKAAAIQFSPKPSVQENAAIIIDRLRQCADQGVRVAAFQECALTGYDKQAIASAASRSLMEAERLIAQACAELNMYAIVGAPHDDRGKRYNTAAIFTPDGDLLARYAKIQLVGGDDWAEPGDEMIVFPIDEILCSVIICHDERYPELTRLPVLAGARIVFYISSESSITAEKKLDPYRAQICARADENDIFIVQANSPAMESHGQSRIIDPSGIVLAEAGYFQDEMVIAELDAARATRETALKSLRAPKLVDWWRSGMEKVRIIQSDAKESSQ